MKKNAAKGYEKTNPIQTQFLQRPKMNVNAFLQKDYENETTFRLKKTNPNKANILGLYTATLLQFSCAQRFLANTIYSILPNFPRQTIAAVSGVKMGLLQGWFFSIGKTVFAANLYNFRPSQQLAK
jgi:hypothetical protein